MSSILIKNGYVINVEDGTYSKMDVLIEENIIKKVEKNININADKIIDVAGNVVMPGFVNAHWCGDLDCELKMKEIKGTKSRCIIETKDYEDEVCVVCGKKAKHKVVWGIQY